MTREVNYFLRILKHQYPTLHNKVSISIYTEPNYEQYSGIDGRMRAELNYLKPVVYEISISFPNIGSLYYDIGFYVDFVWSPEDVHGTFNYSGDHTFKFKTNPSL
jgi:hypothetical protein